VREKKRWSDQELNDFKERWQAVTIPVNIQLESIQTALDLKRATQIIKSAEKVALGDCFCRTTLQNCNFPRNVCIFFNDRAESLVKDDRAKYISPEKAKSIISETHKKGLVHLAMYQKNNSSQFPSEICSCCLCCCQALQGLTQLNMKGLVEPSKFLTTYDSAMCTQCGICIDRCYFGARLLDFNEKIIFKKELCFGCGLCVTTCPENAIQLVKRP